MARDAAWQPQFHIELFGAHLISNEEFRVAQHQAGPHVLVL